MQIGIVGLSLSGKTTLFNALTGQHEETGFSGQGGKMHLAQVKVPDRRLDALHTLVPQANKVQTTIEYLDTAGFKTSPTGGFESQFIGDLRPVASLVIVLRAFTDAAIPHPETTIDPHRDLVKISEELLLSDLAVVENRLQKVEKQLKKPANRQAMEGELQLLQRCQGWLEQGKPLRSLDLSDEEAKMIRGFQFLTSKPYLVVINIDEGDIPQAETIEREFRERHAEQDMEFIALSAVIDMEIAQLPEADVPEFLEALGLQEPALTRMIRRSYQLLGLITFFTFGENEVRSWTIKSGATAQQAAGEIHSDLERGFIRAETVRFEELMQYKTLGRCREMGVLRLEGREYVVQDGDVITFRFNV